MKKLILLASGMLLINGCADSSKTNSAVTNAANNSKVVNTLPMTNNSATTNNSTDTAKKTAELKAFDDTSIAAAARTAEIDSYVKSIEVRLPSSDSSGTADTLKRRETNLSGETLKDVTDEKWVKMDTYYDGEKLMRLKVYSAEGQKKTEEFYFYNDKLIYAFIENDGMGKKGDVTEAKGDKFYFGSEGLFAEVKADGAKVDTSSEEFKKYDSKLSKEAAAFRNAAK